MFVSLEADVTVEIVGTDRADIMFPALKQNVHKVNLQTVCSGGVNVEGRYLLIPLLFYAASPKTAGILLQ